MFASPECMSNHECSLPSSGFSQEMQHSVEIKIFIQGRDFFIDNALMSNCTM